MWRQSAKFRTGKSGVVKIQRATYNSANGFSTKAGWWQLRDEVFKRDNGQCVPCRQLGKSVRAKDVHHITPLSKGGTNTKANLFSVCDGCHEKRHPGNHSLKTYHNK